MPRAKTPAAEYKKLLLRLPGEMLQSVTHIAEASHRSMNAQIVHVLTEWLAKEQVHAPHRSSRGHRV
jgi:hypothetical protein